MSDEEWEVEKVLDHKKKGRVSYFKIRWKPKDGKEFDDSWEPEELCDHCVDLIDQFWERKERKKRRRTREPLSFERETPPLNERPDKRSSHEPTPDESANVANDDIPCSSKQMQQLSLNSLFEDEPQKRAKRDSAPKQREKNNRNRASSSSSSAIENTPPVAAKGIVTPLKIKRNQLIRREEPMQTSSQVGKKRGDFDPTETLNPASVKPEVDRVLGITKDGNFAIRTKEGKNIVLSKAAADYSYTVPCLRFYEEQLVRLQGI